MEPYTILIIGATGFAQERMLPELAGMKTCRVTALQARNRGKCEGVAKKYAVDHVYDSPSEALKADHYDLAYIATPPHLHVEEIAACYQSGTVRNILVEKPLALTMKELEELIQLSKQHDSVPVFVGHHLRHQPIVRDLKELLERDVIGQVHYAQGSWRYRADQHASYASWRLNQEYGNVSALGDAGIHIIDMMMYLFGRPERAIASGSMHIHAGTYDSATALLSYPDKQVVISSSQAAPHSNNDLVIIGTEGMIEIPNFFNQTYAPEMRITVLGKTDVRTYQPTLLYRNQVESILGISPHGNVATTLHESADHTLLLLDLHQQIKGE